MQIALHHGSSLISRLIRWQQRGPWNHASMVFEDGTVIESREGKGVRKLPRLEPMKGERIQLFSFDHTPEQEDAMRAFAEAQVGKPYDWPMVFGFVSRSDTEGHESGGKWFCSELAFATPLHAGIRLLERIDPWEVSPPHLALSTLLKSGAIITAS